MITVARREKPLIDAYPDEVDPELHNTYLRQQGIFNGLIKATRALLPPTGLPSTETKCTYTLDGSFKTPPGLVVVMRDRLIPFKYPQGLPYTPLPPRNADPVLARRLLPSTEQLLVPDACITIGAEGYYQGGQGSSVVNIVSKGVTVMLPFLTRPDQPGLDRTHLALDVDPRRLSPEILEKEAWLGEIALALDKATQPPKVE